ncbi:unnamed protein product (macronuclear) [Paramecium tetraurelia]|uniref:Chromosome undetermined scaffold_1, whole genome shotgun sequence n=1 Tax=Paramecium tetraurelia TaxID=5888 RepID=Q6BFT2_PARTE|nr:hypothetical protein [Paramecium tetraurelia strain d4-2]XP_001423175.1 uncharacterized protein GSPATT00000212001 [Paramecium tetraurelia]CAH03488.1 hypothetical protein, C48 peptidase motif [Paramecium tetraurelia]CAK55777.1 unnamed protein product [Paramecium tetraurelia]|eukprot:XP_001423175.1 hypothetical protein (macronuclear) [Paramecium tetraurelia strain d4-2]
MPQLTKQLPTNILQIDDKDSLELTIPDAPYPPPQPNNLYEPYYDKQQQENTIQTPQDNRQVIEKYYENENGKKYQFIVQKIEITKAEEGKFRIKSMQNKLDEYLISKSLNQSLNPIYQHDFSFFPINLRNAHWISIIIDPKKEIILYQDSAYAAMSQDIKEGISKIIDYKKPSKIQWKLQTKSPQQKTSQDCGIFVLYALFILFTEGQLVQEKQYDQTYISMVRQNLFQLTVKEAESDLNPELVERIVRGC